MAGLVPGGDVIGQLNEETFVGKCVWFTRATNDRAVEVRDRSATKIDGCVGLVVLDSSHESGGAATFEGGWPD